jgi:hypothetical protein
MASFTSFTYADASVAEFATLSPSVSGGTENNFQTQVQVGEAALHFSGAVNNITVPQAAGDTGGEAYADFADLWYNHIHIVPNRLNAGNVVSNQIRPVEIFNGYFTAQTLNSITGTDVAGTSLPAVLPEAFAPLQSKVHNLTITTTGTPNFAGFYTLNFDTLGDFFLYVSGTRVVAMPFQHNWSEKDGGSVVERLTYNTSILPSEAGIEQAIMWRQYPRRVLEYKFLLASTQTNAARLRALFHALMFGWQHRTFLVPIWTDATRLMVTANAGQAVINVSTTYFDYDVGNYVMLWQDEETYEVLEIQDVGAGTLTATVNLAHTWEAGRTVVMPARLAIVSPQITGTKHTVDIETVPLAFELLTEAYSTNRLVAGARVLYRGFDVLMKSSGYDDTNDFAVNRPSTRNDADIGLFSIDATNPAPQTGNDHSLVFANHQQAADFFAWLDTRKGRYTPVWVPTWAHDLEVIQNIGSSATTLVIKGINYTGLYMPAGVPVASRRDVMVRLTNGQYFFKRILGATVNVDGSENISIDTSFGQIINLSDIDRVSFLVPSRLEADAIELAWHSGDVSQTAFRLVDLLDDTI